MCSLNFSFSTVITIYNLNYFSFVKIKYQRWYLIKSNALLCCDISRILRFIFLMFSSFRVNIIDGLYQRRIIFIIENFPEVGDTMIITCMLICIRSIRNDFSLLLQYKDIYIYIYIYIYSIYYIYLL